MKQRKEKIRQLTRQSFWKIIAYCIVGLLFMALATSACIWDTAHLLAIYMVRLTRGSIMYDVVTQKDFPSALLDVFIFNITNGEAFLSGRDRKLKIEEVGPFRYQEFRTNTNFNLDEEAGILKYTPKYDIRFIPELSIADPRDVEIQMVDIVFMATASKVSEHAFFVRYLFNLAAMKMNRPPIHTTTAYNIMWGTKDTILEFVNNVIPGEINFLKFGILDSLQNNGASNFELNATDEDKFKVISFNGERGLPEMGFGTSKESRCNTFKDAYEGISYPIGITKDTPLRFFGNALCRLIDLEYQGTKSIDYGPEAFVYKIKRESYSNTTDTECVCHLPKCIDGISNTGPCYHGAPSGISNAHFLHSDMKVAERLEGISPDEDKHGSEFIIDPKFGIPLSTRFTIQANLVMGDVSFNSDLKVFANMVVPIMYTKIIQPEIPEHFRRLIWMVYVVGPYIRYVSIIIFFSISSMLIVFAIKLYCSSLVTVIRFPAQELLIKENEKIQ